VLDLCCGPGPLARNFAPLVREVVAIDPCPEMLTEARVLTGQAANIRFVAGRSTITSTPTLATPKPSIRSVRRPPVKLLDEGVAVMLSFSLGTASSWKRSVNRRTSRLEIECGRCFLSAKAIEAWISDRDIGQRCRRT
jgi:hypothetical protein